jgi:hypothetical protein
MVCKPRTLKHWSVMLWWERKPNWLALCRPLSSVCLWSIFRITFSTSLIKCYAMKMWGYSSTILYPSTRWRWVVSFMPRLLYPQYPLDRSGVGLRAGLDTMEKRKNLAPARNQTQTVQTVTIPTTNWAIPALAKPGVIYISGILVSRKVYIEYIIFNEVYNQISVVL